MFPPEPIHLLDTPVHNVSMAETLEICSAWMAKVEHSLHQICTSNPEFVMLAQENEQFKDVLKRAHLSLPDGIGLLYAARFMGITLTERVAGSDLVYQLAEHAAQNGWRLFLLGAAPGVAVKAADVLQKKYPQIQIAGTFSGSPHPDEQQEIIDRINRSEAEILYVAYGAPKQDIWIDTARDSLSTVKIAVGVGGSLDFISGRTPRAPIIWQRLGLEWLFRLLIQPSRWRRMIALPRFVWQVIWSRFF